ncbi:MAG: hypothetical protein WD336_11460 [Trueperaceae bacterium]
MQQRERVALMAHDNCTSDLIEWATWIHRALLGRELICTGTTGERVRRESEEEAHDGPAPSPA